MRTAPVHVAIVAAALLVAPWARADGVACQKDTDCPGDSVCERGQCSAAAAATPPRPGAVPPPPSFVPPPPPPNFVPPPTPKPVALRPMTEPVTDDGFGLWAFGDFFPSDTPEFGPTQQSVFAGLRFSLPVFRYRQGSVAQYLPGLLASAEVGYTAAGMSAGDGDDGLAFGVGLELRWQLPALNDMVMPFARFTYDDRITQFHNLASGTLFDQAFTVSLGAHLVRSIDVHLLLGGTYSGGTSKGLGLGLGHIF